MAIYRSKFISLVLLLLLAGCTPAGRRQLSSSKSINYKSMEFYSNNFKDRQYLDPRFTCDGDNIRPHLGWSEVPAEAKSLALAVFDPDAPGDGFLHYLVVNMPPQDRELTSDDAIPAPGRELMNDFGETAYGGPCPPSGTHRYIFTLYALDVEEINPSNYQEFLRLAEEHRIAEVSITGLYERQQ